MRIHARGLPMAALLFGFGLAHALRIARFPDP